MSIKGIAAIVLQNLSLFKGSLSPSKNKNKSDKDFFCTLHKFVLMRFIQRNQGHRDSVMHGFHSNVNKVNKTVAKVRTIGDRLPLNKCSWIFHLPTSTYNVLKSTQLLQNAFRPHFAYLNFPWRYFWNFKMRLVLGSLIARITAFCIKFS